MAIWIGNNFPCIWSWVHYRGQKKIGCKKRKQLTIDKSRTGPGEKNTFHVANDADSYPYQRRTKGQSEGLGRVTLSLRPKITSSAEELWHKHINKHKRHRIVCGRSRKREGKKIPQFVFAGRKMCLCLFLHVAQSILQCQWAERGVCGFSPPPRYDVLRKGELQRKQGSAAKSAWRYKATEINLIQTGHRCGWWRWRRAPVLRAQPRSREAAVTRVVRK